MATSSPSASGSSYMGFNLNPGTQGGSGAFGAVPNSVGTPPSIFQQVNSQVPGGANLAQGAAGNIAAEQAGVLSPGTINQLRNNAAAMGVSVGQPGGLPGNTISNESLLTNMGLTSEGLSQAGDQSYLSFLSGTGSAMQNPNLLAEIASNNATMAAAPNPAAAAAQQQANLMRMYAMAIGNATPPQRPGPTGPLPVAGNGGGTSQSFSNPLGFPYASQGDAILVGGATSPAAASAPAADSSWYTYPGMGTAAGGYAPQGPEVQSTYENGNPVDENGDPLDMSALSAWDSTGGGQ